ncbi:MAG: hypothetical protein AAB656_00185 [Patescibacteria group bacterium]
MVGKENRITEINYDSRIRYAFAALILTSLGGITRLVNGKSSMAHIFLVPSLVSLREAVVNDENVIRDMTFGISGSVFIEIAQAVYPKLGEAQVEDLVIDSVGILAWLLFEKTARELHDSGLTDPVYSLLRVTKKR